MNSFTAAGKNQEGLMVIIENIQAEDKAEARKILQESMPHIRLVTVLSEDEVQEIKNL